MRGGGRESGDEWTHKAGGGGKLKLVECHDERASESITTIAATGKADHVRLVHTWTHTHHSQERKWMVGMPHPPKNGGSSGRGRRTSNRPSSGGSPESWYVHMSSHYHLPLQSITGIMVLSILN